MNPPASNLEKLEQQVKSREPKAPDFSHPVPFGTDTWMAERLVAEHGAHLRYVGPWKKWMVYRKGRWVVDAMARAQQLLKQCARELYVAAGKQPEAHVRVSMGKAAVHYESAKGRAAAMTLASYEPEVQVLPERLDVDPWVLNVKNGTLNLRTAELKPHDPRDHLTKRTLANYNADAVCPTWDAFLQRIFAGDLEMITYVQRAAGYSLTGDVGERVVFVLHGVGSNGKSTLVETLMSVMAEYSLAAAPNLLVASKSEKHPTELADLLGRRLVVCQETDQEHRFDEAKLKVLTGGDRITARRMREDFWSFAPTHKPWLCTNHRPGIRGQDDAIWDRIRLIPFDVRIPDSEKDKGLAKKLRAEADGILAWAVRGCLAWQREGLQTPSKVVAASRAYREAEDRIGAFLSDCCIVRDGAQVTAKALYEAFRSWAADNGEYELSQKALGQRLAERGFESQRTMYARMWSGVGLKLEGSD